MRQRDRGRAARTATVLAALALGPLLAPSAHASLPDLISLGTRSPALGGTGVADATGYEASYQNPAGLATGQRNLTLGLVYGGYRTTLDGGPYPIEDTLGLVIGGALPLPLGGIMKNRLGLGLGLYLPTGFVNRVRVPLPEVPRATLLDARTVRIVASDRAEERGRDIWLLVFAYNPPDGQPQMLPGPSGSRLLWQSYALVDAQTGAWLGDCNSPLPEL